MERWDVYDINRNRIEGRVSVRGSDDMTDDEFHLVIPAEAYRRESRLQLSHGQGIITVSFILTYSEKRSAAMILQNQSVLLRRIIPHTVGHESFQCASIAYV